MPKKLHLGGSARFIDDGARLVTGTVPQHHSRRFSFPSLLLTSPHRRARPLSVLRSLTVAVSLHSHSPLEFLSLTAAPRSVEGVCVTSLRLRWCVPLLSPVSLSPSRSTRLSSCLHCQTDSLWLSRCESKQREAANAVR
ncbi:MAG: hypothetical protein P4M11_04535 [Candidatus Pacebacteria bacterium]|nr:hypothetical protein [Candidatus Paceibacterota bacterium]